MGMPRLGNGWAKVGWCRYMQHAERVQSEQRVGKGGNLGVWVHGYVSNL